VAKTNTFQAKLFFGSWRETKTRKFHLADVPIWRNLERIDNTVIVADWEQILKPAGAPSLCLSLFLQSIYGEVVRQIVVKNPTSDKPARASLGGIDRHALRCIQVDGYRTEICCGFKENQMRMGMMM
jgi:hypothetical protein